MIGPVLLQTMWEYNHRINTRLLDLAVTVPAAEWDAYVDYVPYSLHETLFHLLAVEEEWLTLCQEGRPRFEFHSMAAYPDVAALRALGDQVYAAGQAYLARLDDTGLAATVSGRLPDGGEHTVVIWRVLIHTLYHSAYHRSEAAVLLTRYGHSPGDIEFYGFMLQR
ncbi:MAG: DinB family protein [Chloroflexia bacterium]